MPPKLDHDVAELLAAGVRVCAVREDVGRRGISTDDLVAGVQLIGQRDVAGLFDEHDQVWHW